MMTAESSREPAEVMEAAERVLPRIACCFGVVLRQGIGEAMDSHAWCSESWVLCCRSYRGHSACGGCLPSRIGSSLRPSPTGTYRNVRHVVSHRDAFTAPMCEPFGIYRQAADRCSSARWRDDSDVSILAVRVKPLRNG